MEKVVSVFCFIVILANAVVSVCTMASAHWTALPAATLVFLVWFALAVMAGVWVLGAFWRKR